MPFDIEDSTTLTPIVAAWTSVLDRANKDKLQFSETAEECMAFFCGSQGFMWDPKYKFRISKDLMSPTFRMTLNKAFELVALFGPILYHRNPVRRVTARRLPEFPMELFMPEMPPVMPGDQMGMMMQQQAMMQAQMQFQMPSQKQAMDAAKDSVRADLMEIYLNYTPNEMPGGGLQAHAEKWITEALVKGRSCLWTTPYLPPQAQRRIIISEYDSVDNLLIDPDATCLDEAKWIARKCVHPIWEVEKEYQLPPGSLRNKANMESADSQERNKLDDMKDIHRQVGDTNDLLVYWKIWSKMGCGVKLRGSGFGEDQIKGMDPQLATAIDEIVGEFSYLVIAKNVTYPLNLHPDKMASMTDADVKQSLSWPVPYWADDRWPVTVLDFYNKPGSVWPIAPMAPGLGELKFLNVMISHLANRIWTSSRDFIAVAQSASDKLKETIRAGEDLAVIDLENIQGDIRKVVQVLQMPPVNMDVWTIIDSVMTLFDKRVGLSDLLYGITSVQMRSAEEAAAKNDRVSVRPDYMAGKVEQALTEASRLEGFCARWFIEAPDVQPLLGDVGAMLWQQLVVDSDVERVVRELEYRVEESTARKPNKDRDIANITQAMPTLLPIFQGYAQMSGDVGPINSMIGKWGKANDFKTDDMTLKPPPQPQMGPDGQPIQQAPPGKQPPK